jgi:hypothetical protein
LGSLGFGWFPETLSLSKHLIGTLYYGGELIVGGPEGWYHWVKINVLPFMQMQANDLI